MYFNSVFIDTPAKYCSEDENKDVGGKGEIKRVPEEGGGLYVCGLCLANFPALYDLILHESRMHFIEFSRIATKLQDLIDEFIVPDEKRELKTFKKEKSPESDRAFDLDDFLERETAVDNEEESKIIQRLQASGQVSLKVKKAHEMSPRKIKQEIKVEERVENVFLRKIATRRPYRRKPKDWFACSNCPLTFDKFSQLRDHERTHKFICDYCGRNYTVKINLKMHIFREHKGVKTFCSECGIQTMNLEEHMKKHQSDQMFVCDICGKEVQGRQRINNHINRSHKSRSARFFCKFCDQGFRYMADLKEHAIKHDPDKKDHKCQECGKCYKRRTELNRHMQSHSGQKWPCLGCGREYAWQRGLRTHQATGNCKGSSQ